MSWTMPLNSRATRSVPDIFLVCAHRNIRIRNRGGANLKTDHMPPGRFLIVFLYIALLSDFEMMITECGMG